MSTLDKLLQQKKEMVEYLKLKLTVEDWHGVQDAASDIREIEAQIKLWHLLQMVETNEND